MAGFFVAPQLDHLCACAQNALMHDPSHLEDALEAFHLHNKMLPLVRDFLRRRGVSEDVQRVSVEEDEQHRFVLCIELNNALNDGEKAAAGQKIRDAFTQAGVMLEVLDKSTLPGINGHHAPEGLVLTVPGVGRRWELVTALSKNMAGESLGM